MTTQSSHTGGTRKVERHLLTVEEAAQSLCISRSRTYELIRRGDLRSIHIGRSHRVPVEALKEFIALIERQDCFA